MAIQVTGVSHVNVTVSADLEEATKHFYGQVMGFQQIPKPPGPRQFIGAWYQIGATQLHLSIEDNPQNNASDRHVCYAVNDLSTAADSLAAAGVEVIPDTNARRFFVRDPGGNLIEITEVG